MHLAWYFVTSHHVQAGNIDEQSTYDSEEKESRSDVESCTCHGVQRTGIRVELVEQQQADRNTPERVAESDVGVEV